MTNLDKLLVNLNRAEVNQKAAKQDVEDKSNTYTDDDLSILIMIGRRIEEAIEDTKSLIK